MSGRGHETETEQPEKLREKEIQSNSSYALSVHSAQCSGCFCATRPSLAKSDSVVACLHISRCATDDSTSTEDQIAEVEGPTVRCVCFTYSVHVHVCVSIEYTCIYIVCAFHVLLCRTGKSFGRVAYSSCTTSSRWGKESGSSTLLWWKKISRTQFYFRGQLLTSRNVRRCLPFLPPSPQVHSVQCV